MKIFNLSASVIPSDSANSVQVVRTSEALAKLKYNVTLCGIPSSTRSDLRLYYDLKDQFETVWVYRLRIPVFGSMLRSVKIFFKILKLGVSATDVFYGRDRYSLLLFCLFMKNKVVLESHTAPTKITHWLIDWILLCFDSKLIVTSDDLKTAYQNAFPFVKNRIDIQVVRNGSSDFFSKVRPKSEIFTIGYVGGVSFSKGAGIILELAKAMPENHFVLVGPLRDGQENFKGLPNVELTGHKVQSQLSEQYSRFDMVVAPYPDPYVSGPTDEFPSPLKISEYFSAGLPVCASRNSATQELISDGVDGILVENCLAEWVAAINSLKGKPELREQLGRLAREQYCKEFSWDIRAESLSRVFD